MEYGFQTQCEPYNVGRYFLCFLIGHQIGQNLKKLFKSFIFNKYYLFLPISMTSYFHNPPYTMCCQMCTICIISLNNFGMK